MWNFLCLFLLSSRNSWTLLRSLNREKYLKLLRNEFNFWFVHGIMNTSGLLQIKWSFLECSWNHEYFGSLVSKWSPCFTLTLQEFVWFDSLRPINNLSVIKGRVFLGWTSTKLGIMFLLKDTTQWRRWGSNPRPFGLESSTLPLSHCASNFTRIPKNSRFHEHSKTWCYCLYLNSIINIQNIEIIYKDLWRW